MGISTTITHVAKPPTPAQLARRKRKNRARLRSRKIAREFKINPPAIGMGRRDYLALFGADADYDAYCDTFIAAAKKAHRRHEFPLEPLSGGMGREGSR